MTLAEFEPAVQEAIVQEPEMPQKSLCVTLDQAQLSVVDLNS